MVATTESPKRELRQAIADLRAWSMRLDAIADAQRTTAEREATTLQAKDQALAKAHETIQSLQTELTELLTHNAAMRVELDQAKAETDSARESLTAGRQELEAVLARTAQVAEDANRQRRISAIERAGFEAELKALRQMLIDQAEPTISTGGRESMPTSPAALHREAAPAAAETDPLIDELAAQFAGLKNGPNQTARIP